MRPVEFRLSSINSLNKRNLLLTKDNNLKIGDLGVAKFLVDTEARTFTGSRAYMSPEQYEWRRIVDEDADYFLHRNPEPYSFNTDVWLKSNFNFICLRFFFNVFFYIVLFCCWLRSLGCVLYELIHLELAFPRGVEKNPANLRFTNFGRFSGILPRYLI